MFTTKLSDIRFDRKSKAILWVEAAVFTVIYGLMFKTWLVTAGMALVATFFMKQAPDTGLYGVLDEFLMESYIL